MNKLIKTEVECFLESFILISLEIDGKSLWFLDLKITIDKKRQIKQLYDRQVYEKVPNDPNVLINTIMKALQKIRLRGDLSSDTLNYFLVKDPKFARFYLLPKIHKRLHDVPGRPVISNCGFYTENISSFLDHHLQPLVQRVKSYIKDTNHFLNKIKKDWKVTRGSNSLYYGCCWSLP